MVDVTGVGSFSANDFDAVLRAQSQVFDNAVRQTEAAQNRAMQAVLQARAQRAQASRQIRDLNVKAQKEGFTFAPDNRSTGRKVLDFFTGRNPDIRLEKTPYRLAREAAELEALQAQAALSNLQTQTAKARIEGQNLLPQFDQALSQVPTPALNPGQEALRQLNLNPEQIFNLQQAQLERDSQAAEIDRINRDERPSTTPFGGGGDSVDLVKAMMGSELIEASGITDEDLSTTVAQFSHFYKPEDLIDRLRTDLRLRARNRQGDAGSAAEFSQPQGESGFVPADAALQRAETEAGKSIEESIAEGDFKNLAQVVSLFDNASEDVLKNEETRDLVLKPRLRNKLVDVILERVELTKDESGEIVLKPKTKRQIKHGAPSALLQPGLSSTETVNLIEEEQIPFLRALLERLDVNLELLVD